jgi:hypothetical protein
MAIAQSRGSRGYHAGISTVIQLPSLGQSANLSSCRYHHGWCLTPDLQVSQMSVKWFLLWRREQVRGGKVRLSTCWVNSGTSKQNSKVGSPLEKPTNIQVLWKNKTFCDPCPSKTRSYSYFSWPACLIMMTVYCYLIESLGKSREVTGR